ncbi:hypothetical protein [Mucilaginibacter antarcticus]
MEAANENHQTRLFVSHDAPQQGANAAIGAQYMLNATANLYARTGPANLYTLLRVFSPSQPKYDQLLALTETPAAKQMLINRIDQSLNINNTIHNSWQTELTNLGYPANCRNIAISNGSECGLDQNLLPGYQLLTIQGRVNTNAVDFGGEVALGSIFANQPQVFTLNGLPGSSKFTGDFQVYAVAETGGNAVYRGKLTYTKKVFGLINVNHTITDRTNYAPGGMYPFDSFGGGKYDIPATIAGSPTLSVYIAPAVGFVPTTSALDISGSATNLAKADYRVSYVGANPPSSPKNTPFSNFITAYNGKPGTAGENEGHISLYRAQWRLACSRAKWQHAFCKLRSLVPNTTDKWFC